MDESNLIKVLDEREFYEGVSIELDKHNDKRVVQPDRHKDSENIKIIDEGIEQFIKFIGKTQTKISAFKRNYAKIIRRYEKMGERGYVEIKKMRDKCDEIMTHSGEIIDTIARNFISKSNLSEDGKISLPYGEAGEPIGTYRDFFFLYNKLDQYILERKAQIKK